jgi:hypothetical protein
MMPIKTEATKGDCMGFLSDIFGNKEKQFGKIAIHLNSRLKEVRESWTDYCLVVLNKMEVEPIRSKFSESGLACVAAFQYFMFTQLVTERGYIKGSQ